MEYSELSPSTLKEMHYTCLKAYRHDRALEAAAKEFAALYGQYFGVDEFPDWNVHVRRIEAELTNRNVPFSPIELRG